jgi:hypothetical protein
LYVTKDNRVKTQKNKLCWIVCIGLVAAVIILGILAACKIKAIKFLSVEMFKIFLHLLIAGAFNKSMSPIEARNLKSIGNETVASAGIFASPDAKKSSDSATTTSTTTASTLPPIKPSTAVLLADDKINYGENFSLS